MTSFGEFSNLVCSESTCTFSHSFRRCTFSKMALSEGYLSLGSLYGWEETFFASNSLVPPYLHHLTSNTFNMKARTIDIPNPGQAIHSSFLGPDDSMSKCIQTPKGNFSRDAKRLMCGDYKERRCWLCDRQRTQYCHVIEYRDTQVWLSLLKVISTGR